MRILCSIFEKKFTSRHMSFSRKISRRNPASSPAWVANPTRISTREAGPNLPKISGRTAQPISDITRIDSVYSARFIKSATVVTAPGMPSRIINMAEAG